MCDNRTDPLRSLSLSLEHAGILSNCTHHLTTTTHSVNITSRCSFSDQLFWCYTPILLGLLAVQQRGVSLFNSIIALAPSVTWPPRPNLKLLVRVRLNNYHRKLDGLWETWRWQWGQKSELMLLACGTCIGISKEQFMANKVMNYSEEFIGVTKMKVRVHVTKSMTEQPNKISPYFCTTWNGGRKIHVWSEGLLLLLNLCHLRLFVCLPKPKLFIADIICRGNGMLKQTRIVRDRKEVTVTYSKTQSVPWTVYQTQKAIHWPFLGGGIKYLQKYWVAIWTVT